MFCWFDWEDETTTVHSINIIKQPRKPYEEYSVGEEIVGKLPKYSGLWKGVIVEIGESRKDLIKNMEDRQKKRLHDGQDGPMDDGGKDDRPQNDSPKDKRPKDGSPEDDRLKDGSPKVDSQSNDVSGKKVKITVPADTRKGKQKQGRKRTKAVETSEKEVVKQKKKEMLEKKQQVRNMMIDEMISQRQRNQQEAQRQSNKHEAQHQSNQHEAQPQSNQHEAQRQSNQNEAQQQSNQHEAQQQRYQHEAQRQSNQNEAQQQSNQHEAQRQRYQHEAQRQSNQHEAQPQSNQHEAQRQSNQHEPQQQSNQHEAQQQRYQHEAQGQSNQHEAQPQSNQHEAQRQSNQHEAQRQSNQHEAQRQRYQHEAQRQSNQHENRVSTPQSPEYIARKVSGTAPQDTHINTMDVTMEGSTPEVDYPNQVENRTYSYVSDLTRIYSYNELQDKHDSLLKRVGDLEKENMQLKQELIEHSATGFITATPRKIKFLRSIVCELESKVVNPEIGEMMQDEMRHRIEQTSPLNEDVGHSTMVFEQQSPAPVVAENNLDNPIPEWEVSHTAAGVKKQQLVPGHHVYLVAAEISQALIVGENPKKLAGALLDKFFTKDVLAKSSAKGTRKAHNTKYETKPLPKPVVDTVLEFVLRKFKTESGKPALEMKDYITYINNKCASARRVR